MQDHDINSTARVIPMSVGIAAPKESSLSEFISFNELSEVTKRAINFDSGLSNGKYLLISSLPEDLKKVDSSLRADIVLGNISDNETKEAARSADGEYIEVGEQSYDYTFAYKKYVDMRIWSTNKLGYPRFEFLLSDINVLKLFFEISPKRILFADLHAEMRFKSALVKIKLLIKRSKNLAEYKIHNVRNPLPDTYITHTNPNLVLSPYQEEGVSYLYNTSGAAFMEQGTGKTPIAINLMSCIGRRTVRDLNRFATVLVICPQNIQQNWIEEILRFATGPCKVTLCRGNQLYRTKLFAHSLKDNKDKIFTALVISYDAAVSDIETLKYINWDFIILDESQYIKSASTKRWEALKQLRDGSTQRLLLTGTPYANTITDFWTQLEFIGHGVSGFSSLNAFKNYYQRFDEYGSSGENSPIAKITEAKNIPVLQDILSRYSVIFTKKEAGLQLPDKLPVQLLSIEMTEAQKTLYRDIADKLLSEIKNILEDKEETKRITADHILTKLLRLAQITSGVVSWDADIDEETGDILTPKLVEYIHKDPLTNPKIAALIEDWTSLDRSKDEKAIVWATFVPNILQLQEAFKKKGIDCVTYYGATSFEKRVIAENRFNNDPTCKVFIGNPKSASVGLNLLGYDYRTNGPPTLNTYTSTVYYFSSNWSHLERAQSEDRAHRRGTRMPVAIKDICVPGTIDMQIRNVVKKKRESGEAIKDISEILNSMVEL